MSVLHPIDLPYSAREHWFPSICTLERKDSDRHKYMYDVIPFAYLRDIFSQSHHALLYIRNEHDVVPSPTVDSSRNEENHTRCRSVHFMPQ